MFLNEKSLELAEQFEISNTESDFMTARKVFHLQ